MSIVASYIPWNIPTVLPQLLEPYPSITCPIKNHLFIHSYQWILYQTLLATFHGVFPLEKNHQNCSFTNNHISGTSPFTSQLLRTPTAQSFGRHLLVLWIGKSGKSSPEAPILNPRNHGFRLRFPLTPIHWFWGHCKWVVRMTLPKWGVPKS